MGSEGHSKTMAGRSNETLDMKEILSKPGPG
jgi:hypothetical protein